MQNQNRLFSVLACLTVLLGSLQALSALAEVRFQPLAADTLVIINGESLAKRPVDALTRAVQRQDRQAQQQALLDGIIENRLLAAHLRSQVMRSGFGPLARQAAPPQVAEHAHDLDLMVKVWREYQQIVTSMMPLNKKALANTQVRFVYDAAALQALLALDQADPMEGKKHQAMGKENLTPQQIAAAQRFVLAEFRLGERTEHVSLWDAYRIQNVHKRTAIRRAQQEAIEKAVKQWVTVQWQENRLAETQGWQTTDFAQLRLLITDKHVKEKFLLDSGAVEDLHHDSALLNRMIKGVTDQDIDRYYDAHKEDYRQIEQIRARHITVQTQEEADAVYRAIDEGLAFEEAVKQYSISASKDLPIAGDLGVIRRTDPDLPFVKKLTLIQPQGRVSTPYRMLDGKTYELILVDKRESSVLPKTDKSLRFQIATQIARERAVEFYGNLRERVTREAEILVNSILVNAPVLGVKP